MIEIKNLHASTDGKGILKGVSLHIQAGEIHTIMGPNGAGKSTLAKILAGDPAYEVTEGEVWFKGQNILEMAPEARAHLGLFMGFQYPLEIPGINNVQFLFTCYNAKRKANGQVPVSEEQFQSILDEKMAIVEMRAEFRDRSLNEGFSGGEKKRNEILQMAILDPSLAILDETDSGLDIDAMRIVAKGVNRLFTPDKALLLITHYQRLLDYIKTDFVHIMVDGKIILSGGPELALQLEKSGYETLLGSKGMDT
ncbi:MAG: Fe-S cluster assembly ATPase SufC [Chlamydiae bacterium]|nr:Fe-S cluster assembly ATPase SufC [Chlamydiota bacterium]